MQVCSVAVLLKSNKYCINVYNTTSYIVLLLFPYTLIYPVENYCDIVKQFHDAPKAITAASQIMKRTEQNKPTIFVPYKTRVL